MPKKSATDENIVIFYKGKYYDLPKEVWQKQGIKLAPLTAQSAKDKVIDKGKIVGYVPQIADGQAGGYSTVLNLSAILDKQAKK
jgi:hypothetical protein